MVVLRKIILYPIFLECCNYTKNTFWKNLFEDMAYGICPYGTYINKDVLYCNFKNKEFSYRFQNKDSETIYQDIFQLFSNKLELLSSDDKTKEKLDFEKFRDEIDPNNWSNVKKSVKNYLLENYIIDIKNNCGLSITDARKLLGILLIYIIFKIVELSHINYNGGKITNIKHLNENDVPNLLNNNVHKLMIKSSFNFCKKNSEVEKVSLSQEWQKYLQGLCRF